MTGPAAWRSPQAAMDLAARAGAVLMLVAIVLASGVWTPGFLAPESLANTVKQSSFIGIAAVGMVFVLLTAGIDLSVGSIMYLGPLIAGLLMRDAGVGVAGGLVACVAVGMALGAINAALIVGLRVIPFIVTLSTLFLFRGFGAWLTQSRQIDFPPEVRGFGQAAVLAVPVPILVFAAVALAAHVVLRHTPFGRPIYAFGNDSLAARKAGLPVRRIDAGFGEGREFDVIAAAVLGGASLFGSIGRARVLERGPLRPAAAPGGRDPRRGVPRRGEGGAAAGAAPARDPAAQGVRRRRRVA